MEIRLVDKDSVADRELIFEGAAHFIEFMDDPDMLPAAGSEEMKLAISRLLDHPTTGVFLAEDEDGTLLGGIGGIMIPYVWDVEKAVCEELFWWVSPDAPKTTALRLIRALEQAGKDAGASMFLFHSLTVSPKGVGRLYEKMGLKPVQTSYVRIE